MNALKSLPWRSLFLSAVLSVLGVKTADLILSQLLSHTDVVMKLLLTKPGFTLIYLCTGLALGSLGVFCFEKWEHNYPLYGSTLWALVLCIMISLWLVLHFDIPGLSLVKIHYIHTFGIVVGVFWRGKHHGH